MSVPAGRMSNSRVTDVLAAGRTVSLFAFGCYLAYLITFLLNLGARWAWLGAIRPTVVLLVVTSIALLVQQDRLRGRLQSPLAKSLLLIAAWILVTLPFVEFPGSFLRGNWQGIAKAMAFFFFTALIVDSPRRFGAAVGIIILCQLIRILEPLYLHATAGYWGDKAFLAGTDGEFMDRLSGAPWDVVNPNGLGYVVVSVFPWLHYMLLGSSSRALKVAYFVLAPLTIWVLVLTGSRSAAVAFSVVVIAIVAHSQRRAAAVAVVAAAFIVVLPQLGDQLWDRYASIVGKGDANSATAAGRYEAMRNDFRVGLNAPVFGHGVGTSAEARYHSIGHAKISHNMYGEAFIELGVIGLVLYSWMIFRIGSEIVALRRQTVKEQDALQFRRGMFAVSAWFWASVVFSVAQYGVSEYHWYLMAGLVVAMSNVLKQARVGAHDVMVRRRPARFGRNV